MSFFKIYFAIFLYKFVAIIELSKSRKQVTLKKIQRYSRVFIINNTNHICVRFNEIR